MATKGHSGKPLHKRYAETGAVEEPPGVKPAPAVRTRFREGGFVKTGAVAQTRGARAGYAHRTGKSKK